MTFNHYAKLKRIIAELESGWYIVRIDKPTRAQTFRGEVREFTHYYRLYDMHGEMVKYGKFQQIDRLAQALGMSVEELPIVEHEGE